MKTKYIITILILITIGILSVISYNNQDKEINHVSPSEMDNNTKSDQDTEIVTNEYESLKFPNNDLDTSDWKTYRNEEFGFEVKYPSDWAIEFNGVKNNTPNGMVGDGFSESGYGGVLRVFPNGAVSINNLEIMRVRNISLDDQVINLENNELLPTVGVGRYIQVNNVIGVETKDFEGPGFYVYKRYILEGKNNTTYEFGGLNESNADKYKSEIEQIILSFKTVNQ